MKYMLTMLALLLSAIAAHAVTYNQFFVATTKDGKDYITHSNSKGTTVPSTKDQLKVYVNGVLKYTSPLQNHEPLGTDPNGPKIGTITPNVTGSSSGGGGGGKKNLDGGQQTDGVVEFDESRDGTLMIVTNVYTGLATHYAFRSVFCGRIYFTTMGHLGNWNLSSRDTYPCQPGGGKPYNPASGAPGGWFSQYIVQWADENEG